jgi:microcin C transport system substrate-binding protein
VPNALSNAVSAIYVRRALIESFDYESVNRRIFYGAYRRTDSFFTNSTMAATGKPDSAETALLKSLGPRACGAY